jgi:hypothetical protein
MAENNNVGGAIALGTNLQPDNTQPLTRGTGQWLQAEMAQEARRQKQQQQEQQKIDEVFASLRGGKYDAVLDPLAKNIYSQAVAKRMDARTKSEAQMVAEEATREFQRLNKRQQLRDNFFTEAKAGLAPQSMIEYFAQGKEQEYVQQYPFQESIVQYGGDVYLNLPKITSPSKYISEYMNKNASQMLAIDEKKKLQTGQMQYVTNFTPTQLQNMASDLANEFDYRERVYLENGDKLNPIINDLVSQGIDPTQAKVQAVADFTFNEMQERNQASRYFSKPSPQNANFGNVRQVQEFTYNDPNKVVGWVSTKFPVLSNNPQKQADLSTALTDMPVIGIALPQKGMMEGGVAANLAEIFYDPISDRVLIEFKDKQNIGIVQGIPFEQVDDVTLSYSVNDIDRLATKFGTQLNVSKDYIKPQMEGVVKRQKEAFKPYIPKVQAILNPTGGGGTTNTGGVKKQPQGKSQGETFQQWKNRTGKTSYTEYEKT